MGTGSYPDTTQAFAAAIDWWRDAGVDATFLDEPRSWLPLPEDKPAAQAEIGGRIPSRPVIAAEPIPAPVLLPDDLDAFHQWWMTTPELDGGHITRRVKPRGAASPELMVLACAPEGSDRDHLLSGPEGKLLDGFLAACGLAAETVYYATALPCHSPGADWSPQANRLAADALQRHIALVKPARILVLGFVVLPLLGHDSPQGPAVSLSFNHEGATVPMLAVRRIPAVASQPRWKSALWQAWLGWTAHSQ